MKTKNANKKIKEIIAKQELEQNFVVDLMRLGKENIKKVIWKYRNHPYIEELIEKNYNCYIEILDKIRILK